MNYDAPNRQGALLALRQIHSTPAGDLLVEPVRTYIADLEQEIVLLRTGVITTWTLWHDSRWRLFNLDRGMIGCVSYVSRGVYRCAWRKKWHETDMDHEDHYGTEVTAKACVEERLGVIKNA